MNHPNSQLQENNAAGNLAQQKNIDLAALDSPMGEKSKKFAFKFDLKAQIVTLALALSIIPTGIIGFVAYKTVANEIVSQANQKQLERTEHLAQMLKKYIDGRVNEARVIASSPIFTNPNIMDRVTISQKKAALDSFQAHTGFYDSIVYIDLEGNPLFQSQSEFPIRENYGDRAYFQKAIATKQPVMNTVGISRTTGEPRLEFAIPITNAWTDEILGVLRFRIPNQNIKPLLADYANKNEQWHVINTKNIFTISSLNNLSNQPVADYYPELQTIHVNKQIQAISTPNPERSQEKQIISYAPVKIGAINPNLNVGTAMSINTDIVYAPLKSLRLIFLIGTVSAAVLAGLVASWLAKRLTDNLTRLTSTVDRLSQGELEAKTQIESQDELGILGDHLDYMAEQLKSSLKRQKTIAQTCELMLRISQAGNNRDLQLPLSLFLKDVRHFISAERVIFYQFDEQWRGTVIAESVDDFYPRILGIGFDDPCFTQDYVKKYESGRIQAITDIYEANLTECHLQQLEPYQVKASLVVPVIINATDNNKSAKLIGLLIAHQCSEARVWSQSNIDYLQQIAFQLAQVLSGFINHKQKDIEQAVLKKDLAHVSEASQAMAQGNFNVSLRDKTNSSNEIVPTFEQIIGNIRQTIAQIKTPTQKIQDELTTSKQDTIALKDRLRKQANVLTLLFAFIDQATISTQEIAEKINSTSETVDSIVSKVQGEKTNFNTAISFITQLEDALQHNNEKVKELSNASEKMTRVIAVIRKINLRASLLANKLQQRIPKLDDSEYGLREEIESIKQSIAATKELENVIHEIDREIARILRDYEAKEQQIQQENNLVSRASSNLINIAEATKNVQQNMLSLVNMTKIQVQTTDKIAEFKDNLHQANEEIDVSSDRATQSLEQASITAQDLRNAIEFFHLEQQAEQN